MEHFYEDLLRLSNLTVNRVESEDKRIRIYCEVSSDSICPVCQIENTIVHQSYERVVRDLDISGRQVSFES